MMLCCINAIDRIIIIVDENGHRFMGDAGLVARTDAKLGGMAMPCVYKGL